MSSPLARLLLVGKYAKIDVDRFIARELLTIRHVGYNMIFINSARDIIIFMLGPGGGGGGGGGVTTPGTPPPPPPLYPPL